MFKKDYMNRVMQEKGELDDKIKRLVTFMVGESFAALDVAGQLILLRQHQAMLKYSEILAERIEQFDSEQTQHSDESMRRAAPRWR
jgi:hypothetical protein